MNSNKFNGEFLPDDHIAKLKKCFDCPNDVLYAGFRMLMNSASVAPTEAPHSPGNYVISNKAQYYAGEADNLHARIKQQFNENTSTFYKSYKKKVQQPLPLTAFELRLMEVKMGRNELEEFCIANCPANLNTSQTNARVPFSGTITGEASELWYYLQKNSDKALNYLEQRLNEIPFIPWVTATPEHGGGVYLINDKEGHTIYIGESSDICERYNTHSKTTRFSAFRRHVAKEILGIDLKTKVELGNTESNDKKRMFVRPEEDEKINQFTSTCRIKMMSVLLGRFEFEKYLIRTLRPRLNKKDK
jgi:predicted GIY-YIG superfamily endonuclease